MITQEDLLNTFTYSKESGVFTRILTGADCGSKYTNADGKSYVNLYINNTCQKAHRMAWLYVTGDYPANQIDHINGDGTDNSFSNLRSVTSIQNSRNQRRNKNNKSGASGVHLHRGGWRAVINMNGKEIYIGKYKDINSAKLARWVFERVCYYDESHGSVRPL